MGTDGEAPPAGVMKGGDSCTTKTFWTAIAVVSLSVAEVEVFLGRKCPVINVWFDSAEAKVESWDRLFVLVLLLFAC
jgi:hypothetical protein